MEIPLVIPSYLLPKLLSASPLIPPELSQRALQAVLPPEPAEVGPRLGPRLGPLPLLGPLQGAPLPAQPVQLGLALLAHQVLLQPAAQKLLVQELPLELALVQLALPCQLQLLVRKQRHQHWDRRAWELLRFLDLPPQLLLLLVLPFPLHFPQPFLPQLSEALPSPSRLPPAALPSALPLSFHPRVRLHPGSEVRI